MENTEKLASILTNPKAVKNSELFYGQMPKNFTPNGNQLDSQFTDQKIAKEFHKEDKTLVGFNIKQATQKGKNLYNSKDIPMDGYYVYITKHKNEIGIWPISKKIRFNQVALETTDFDENIDKTLHQMKRRKGKKKEKRKVKDEDESDDKDSLSDLVNKESDGELDHETSEMFKKIKEHKEAELEQKQDEQFKEFDAQVRSKNIEALREDDFSDEDSEEEMSGIEN